MSKVGLDDLVVAGASAEDLTALPRLPWWPSLAPEALYGLAGRIVETVAPYTEADPVAVLAHLLVGIGNLIGSGPHALVGSERHPLRFYAAPWWGSRARRARCALKETEGRPAEVWEAIG
jgi:hypothetical protein